MSSYQCTICEECESVSESSSQYSSESDDEYSSDQSESGTSSDTDSEYSDECKSSDSERSSKSDDENEIFREKYKGFDGYPAEIQEFIKNKVVKEETENNNKDAIDNILNGLTLGGNEDQPPPETHSRRKRQAPTLIPTSGLPKRHHRKKGGHHRKRSHHRHSHKSKRHHHQRRYKRNQPLRMTKMVWPSGKKFYITMPVRDKSGWHCGKKSTLITLRKNGRMGKREYTIVSKEMTNTKADHSSGWFSKYDIVKVQKIVNPCLWKRYRYQRWNIIRENGSANEQLLWHGSMHVGELVDTGFDERHANPKGMFGAGLYFATNSAKSNQYVYNGGCTPHKDSMCLLCERQMLLCRVALGKVMQYQAAHNHAHAPVGYHSVEGVVGASLKYSENIVYRGEQVYPEYIITYKLVK